MPKLKTKSSAKKRFKITGTGKVRAAAAGTMILCAADARLVKSYMPNA